MRVKKLACEQCAEVVSLQTRKVEESDKLPRPSFHSPSASPRELWRERQPSPRRPPWLRPNDAAVGADPPNEEGRPISYDTTITNFPHELALEEAFDGLEDSLDDTFDAFEAALDGAFDEALEAALEKARCSREGSTDQGTDEVNGDGPQQIDAAQPPKSWACADETIRSSCFAAHGIRYGRPLEAGAELHTLLGLSSAAELEKLRSMSEIAIVGEIEAHHQVQRRQGPVERDLVGCTELDWLQYVQSEVALEEIVMDGRVMDAGHGGMRLDDFVAHPVAVAAGLKRSHVLVRADELNPQAEASSECEAIELAFI